MLQCAGDNMFLTLHIYKSLLTYVRGKTLKSGYEIEVDNYVIHLDMVMYCFSLTVCYFIFAHTIIFKIWFTFFCFLVVVCCFLS